MVESYNSISLTRFASTIAAIMGIEGPAAADDPIDGFNGIIAERADRAIVYNPDAIGMWLYQKYFTDFLPVLKHTSFCVPFRTVMPSKTPVCFATMYTGTLSSVHGIQSYTKPVVRTDSLFDALIRAGRKTALVAVEGSSMSKIFAGKDMDYYIMGYDMQVKDKTLELIKSDEYDFISIYTQEYDDMMHKTGPGSTVSLQASRNQIKIFDVIACAVDKYWRSYRSLITFSPDHGVH
jgi:predicted AlkP superfamily pyrophosphatase or phosphodiesterase